MNFRKIKPLAGKEEAATIILKPAVDAGLKFMERNGTLVNSGNDDYKIYDKDNKLIRESKKEQKTDTINSMGPGVQFDAYHFQNFINAVREGKPLNSPITEGHKSVLLCHLGNIAQRVSRELAM